MNKKCMRWINLAILSLVAILIASSGRLPARADGGSPADMLQRAWRNAQDTGSYRFISDLNQTLIPRPIPQMIGQQETALNLALDGAVVLPDQAYMDLRVASGNRSESVALLRDGGQSFMLQDGALKPVEEALNLASQSNDVLGYLAAAEQVTLLDPPEGHPELARYGFVVSGPRYAEYVRQQAEAATRAEPGAPEGLTLKPLPALQTLSGQGELWVNQAGLPVRQVVDLEMPEIAEEYGAHIRMTVDLSAYGKVEALPRAVRGADGTWHLEGALTAGTGPSLGAFPGFGAQPDQPAQAAVGWRAWLSSVLPRPSWWRPVRIAPTDVALFFLILLVLLIVRYYRRNWRRCYTLIVLILIPSMVLTPLLQAGGVVRFVERQVQAAEARAASLPGLLRGLGFEPQEIEAATADQGPAAQADVRTNDAKPASVTQRSPLTARGLANAAASRTALQASNGESQPSRCGDGEPGVDTDGDGLTDQVELCLGTDPENADTDGDTIADTLEIQGFDLAGEHWSSDPLKPDSNEDGIADDKEWASADAPFGKAASADLDGDGIPNLWEDDDDGDGVPDAQDLSPFAVTDPTAVLNLSTEGGGFGGYQFIEIQVRPVTADHLRYSTTALDWPNHDEQGTIRDLDASTADLRLMPFLRVTTNVQPAAELAEQYGFRSWESDGQFILLVPLMAVEDGGAIYTFYGKVAYAPGQTDDIQWQAELIWMAQMQHDSWKYEYHYTDVYKKWPQIVGMETEAKVVHQYQDEFRLTGLQVTKDQGFEAAVFGTPEWEDDLYLFQVLLGLRDVYVGGGKLEGQEEGETALQEIAQRFATYTEPNDSTFGVTPSSVAMTSPTQYGYQDAGLVGVGAQVPDYLNTYQANYGQPRCQEADGDAVACGSLVVAYEQAMGVHDLKDLPLTDDLITADLSQLHVNLADVSVLETRGSQLRMYEQNANGAWEMVTTARMLELVEQRYTDVYDDTGLRDLYPGLKIDDLRLIAYAAYLWAASPAYRAIALDGQLLVPPVADEAQLALARALDPELEGEIENVLDYVGVATGIADIVGTGIYIAWAAESLAAIVNWVPRWTYEFDEYGDRISYLSEPMPSGWDIFGASLFMASAVFSTVMMIANVICDNTSACLNEDALFAFNTVADGLAILAQLQCTVDLLIKTVSKGLEEGIKGFKSLMQAIDSVGDTVGKVGLVVQAVGVVIGAGVSAMMFALAVAFSGGDPIVWRVALFEMVVTIVWSAVLLAINFIPLIGPLLSALFSLIDMLLSFIFGLLGLDQFAGIVALIIGIFYSADVVTTLQAAEFGEFDSDLVDADLGMIGGNTFRLNLPASGVIQKEEKGNDNDLNRSYVEGLLMDHPVDGGFEAQDMSQPRECQIVQGDEEDTPDTLVCNNTATLGYALTPQVNGAISFVAKHLYATVWAEYMFFGALRVNSHVTEAQLPEEDPDPSTFYLDVLPATLTELWHWSELTNPDRDGDGLTNDEETALDTDPDNWDTDGDGLSDKYEWDNTWQGGADPLLPDTDGDGLTDGLERRLGTRIDLADTDGDGLSDGEEVRRQEGGVPVGGWQANLPEGTQAWVSSDPLNVDADGDDLNDAEERANDLSPHAASAPVPALRLSGAPIQGLPGGRAGTYWLPGEEPVEFTIELANWAGAPVTTDLRLTLPAWLDTIAGGGMQGDRTIPMVQEGNTLSWPFSEASPLQVYEVISITVTARVDPATTSANSDIALELLYGETQLRKTISAVVDGDDPDVAIIAPSDGAYLRGDYYVVGGSTTDPTTWITTRSLSIVPQGSAANFQALPVRRGPWAYTWELPATDGVYSLKARATDAMGHESTTEPLDVTVDNTPPVATVAYEMVEGTVHLSGTATDNLAGVRWVQISLDGQPWRSVPFDTSGWSFDWTLGTSAQGKHEVVARAIDRSGNESATVRAEIVVDSVAPSSIVNSGADRDAPPAVQANAAFNLTGVADEGGHLPLPAAPAELASGMDVFDDSAVWLGLSTIHDNDGGVLATWIGDLNADRLSDLAVGLPGPEGDAGFVAVLYGRAGGWPVPPDLEMLASSPMRFNGVPGARLGSLLAAAGDVNGDNLDDLLIGERASSRAFLIFGLPRVLGGITLDAGLSGYRVMLDAPATITGLAAAGNVDGDGYGDLLIRAGETAYLVLGRPGPWAETLDVAAEAVATFSGVTGALGVGDVDNDQFAEWVTLAHGQIALYGWNASSQAAQVAATFAADADPRAVALGDVDADGYDDWMYSDGTSRILVYGSGATPHTFGGYDGFFAAPGDVDGDGRADILLTTAAGVATLVHHPEGGSPAEFATIDGVGGAATAPYAAGADLNADGSAELLLIPSQAAAEARGFDAPDFSSGFISPQALPLGTSSTSLASATSPAGEGGMSLQMLGMELLSTGPDTLYVDDDSVCDGNSPCYTTIQAAVNASDGGGDTIIVYPGAYDSFSVPADARYNNLTVQGVSADAVFVDGAGSDAIRVAADGVRLSNLTVRNGTSGVLLEDGAGVPAVAGGPETAIDHLVVHSVKYPVNISQSAALNVTDSTLVGNGTDPIIRVGSTPDPATHTWSEDTGLAQPLSTNGGLAATAGTLYAMPGGADRTVYAATPGTDGALGAWSAAFQVPHEMPVEDGKSAIAAGGDYFFQMHPYYKAPDLGTVTGKIMAVAVADDGDVYVGGSFSNVGGVGALNIARWDSTDKLWHPLGTSGANNNGVAAGDGSGAVYALTIVSNGDVYVGGHFDHAYNAGTDVYAQNIARWNGSQWLALGEAVVDENGIYGNGVSDDDGHPTNATVYALAHDSEDIVFVGGRFRHFHESLAAHLRGEGHTRNFVLYHPTMWVDSGVTWNPMGTLLKVGESYNSVRTLAWSGGSLLGKWFGNPPVWTAGTLYAGGDFLSAGNWSATHMASLHKEDPWQPPAWNPMGPGDGGIPVPASDVAVDHTTGKVYAVSDDAASGGVYEWNGSTWSILSGATGAGGAVGADASGNVYAGMVNGSMYALTSGGTALQSVGGETTRIWDLVPDNAGHMLVARGADAAQGGIRRWASASLNRRNLSTGTWESVPAPAAMEGAHTPLIAADDAGNLYATWNEVEPDTEWQHAHLYALPAGSTTWQDRGTSTWGQHAQYRELASVGSRLYAFSGFYPYWSNGAEIMYHGTYVYDLATQQWSWGDDVNSSAIDAYTSPSLVSIASDGVGHMFILAPSYNVFTRYDKDADWMAATKPTILDTSQPSAMARVGHYLYAYATPTSGVTTNIFRYGEVGLEQRVQANRNVFVLPDTATSGTWRTPDSYRFAMAVSTEDSDWVAPSGVSLTPWLGWSETAFTSAQAAFADPTNGLYRLSASSQLTAGYHHYVAVAHVYPSQEACSLCGSAGVVWGETTFATVREAVESGAARVLVHPGRYPQSFYLVSGLEVMGSGAELTIIEPPAGTAATLVSAEGVAHASLARVTLAGGANWEGFLAEGGAKGLKLTRTILRDLKTGVRLRGGAEVEIVNNTLVRNTDGIVIEGTTPVNVRNTILAYNTGTGLTHGASPTSLSNTYNDFWANGTDMSPADVSLGSLFVDPRFRSLAGNDLRLAANSPLIDMGAPNDPTTPGGGERVDIGYAEYNAAGFYVSQNYSEMGLNDGLTWGVDAFDQIQPALDAAAATLHSLQGALPAGGYSVAVDAGTYNERVSVPSHVRLVGSGAELTTIDAGATGSAVTFDAVIDGELFGFTVQNASSSGAGVELTDAASGIAIRRNVIRSNAGHGIRLAESSSSEVLFNTIVGNGGAGVVATGFGTWARVRNNILDGNGYGLQAGGDGLIRNEYNLLHNTANLDGVAAGAGTVEADPAFAGTGHYVPSANSPAIDAADPLADVPLAGGVRADLGYKELIACPLTLLFGPQIDSTVTGNSGVAKVEVGVVPVSDANLPATETLPATWQTLTPASDDEPLYYWSQSVSRADPGLYRVYSRATDAAENAETEELDWYEGAFVVDNTAPTVVWGTPALPSSTDAAAVLAVAEAVGTVSTGTGTRDDVKRAYFSVTGPSGTVNYPAERGRAWIPLPTTGSYTIQAIAIDEAGNQASQSATVAVNASSSAATVSNYVTNSGVNSTAVTLRGYVRFTAAGAGQVDVRVNGGAPIQATLDAPGAQFSAWSAEIALPAGEGANAVTITPSLGGTPGTVTTLALILDTTAPALGITTPEIGASVIQTVAFVGTATDAGSGLARVEVSVDGGYTWRQAAIDGDAWHLDWDLGLHQDYVSYPARVRAVDGAGNVTLVERTVAVDSTPPTGLAPVTFGQPVGQHLDAVTSFAVGWNTPVDAGGSVQVLMAVDKSADTVPTTVASGTSATANLNTAGDWYVHLMAQDAAGNQALYHYGPWHVRHLRSAQFNLNRQSIILDGFLDLEHDEWQVGDLLGIDARSGHPQALYLSVDGQYVFLGWSGAWWTLDGTLWAYLDTWWSYGTGTGVDGKPVPGGLTSADRAIEIRGPGDGVLWSWTQDGDHWEWVAGTLDFANGPSGDTEARVPFTAYYSHTLRVIAFALPREAEQVQGTEALAMAIGKAALQEEPAIAPWAVFPTTNPLAETATQSFAWSATNLQEDLQNGHINEDQPTARTVVMAVDTPQASAALWCATSELNYAIGIYNPEPRDITGLMLQLAATTGLGYQSVSGAMLTAGSAGDGSWTLSVPTIGAGETAKILVAAQLATDLSGLTKVMSTFTLSAGTALLTPDSKTVATISHRVDGQAPTVSLNALGGSAIAAGEHTFTGLANDAADDGAGSGVALVQVSLDGGSTWQEAAGTLAWAAALTIPDGITQFTLQARAVDSCGHTSDAASQTFYVDNTPPQVTWTAPTAVTSTPFRISGSTADPAPESGLVRRVEVQVDDEDGAWRAAAGPSAPQNGAQGWDWTWLTPQEDGVTHSLRVRASDAVGNTTVTEWQTTIVDVVAPQVAVTLQETSVVLPDDPPDGETSPAQVPGEEVDDGRPFRIFVPFVRKEGTAQPGRVNALLRTRTSNQVSLLAAGPVLGGTVTDGAGVQTVRVLVYDPLGNASTVEASLADGNWEYTPDLAGWVVGTYALRVQAVDIYGNVRTMGPYLLDVQDTPITGLAASNDGPRMIDEFVTFEASVTGGSNIVYTWDLGDGTTGEGRVAQHAYTEAGEYTARVTASNSEPPMEATTVVTILALSVDAGADQEAEEGDTVTIAATFEGVIQTATIDWGDGTEAEGTVDEDTLTISGDHVYADNGTYTVTVTVDDGAGHTASDALQVTVGNVKPTATLSNDGPQPEATAVTVSFTNVQDPGTEDTLSYSFDWDNDGTYEIVDQDAASAEYTWPDNGTYTVQGRVKDDDGGYNEYTTEVTVDNVAPEIALSGAESVDEGATYTLTLGDITDPGADTVTVWTVNWGDGNSDDYTAGGDVTHVYADGPSSRAIVVDLTDEDGIHRGAGSTSITVNNVAPVVTAGPESQTVQYSEAIAEITFTATDVAADVMTAALSWSADDGATFQTEPPFAGLTLDTGSCTTDAGKNTCIWKVTGNVGMPEGNYTLQLAVADKDDGTTDKDVTLVVQPEEATITFDGDNPVAVQVASPGGSSGGFSLLVCVTESDIPPDGEIDLAQVSMSLVPVGPGNAIVGLADTPTVVADETCVTFSFNEVPVNTYTAQVTVGGGYYAGVGEDVLVVYDPSLGFTTGGGWFYWPDTANDETGYPGDKTNFGYTMKYNKKGKNVQGSLLLIRHLANGTIYRVKSNALDGLALGEDTTVPMGWASFSGKSTYKEPTWPEPIGNYAFMVYVEDRNEPGTGVDRFWIEVNGGLALPREAPDNAVQLEGGNLVVPHNGR